MNRGVFEFRGSGFGYIWLLAWTLFLSVITGGLFFPWAYSAQQRWIVNHPKFRSGKIGTSYYAEIEKEVERVR